MILRFVTLVSLIVLSLAGHAAAQQTIINVPSDALTPAGEHFYLHESQLAPASNSATFATTNFYTYGLTKTTELAVTQYGFDNGGSEYAALGFGFKSVHEVFREQAPGLEAKWTAGFMFPVSLTPTPSDQTAGYFPYTHVTFAVPETKLRLLAGVAAGSENLFGRDSVSALGGVEYPLTKHLSFTGEWFSGNHNLSGLIPGFTYHNRRWIIVAGYKIPNNFHMRESAAVLEAGFFFGSSRHDDEEPPVQHYGIR